MEQAREKYEFDDDDVDTLTASDSTLSRGCSSNGASGSCDDHIMSTGRRLLLRLWFWRRRAIRREEANAGTSQVIRRPRPPKPDAKAQCRAAAAFATLSVHGAVGKVEHVSARMVLSVDNLLEFAEVRDNCIVYWLKARRNFLPEWFWNHSARRPGAKCLQLATGEIAKTVASARAIAKVLHGIFDDAVGSPLLGDDSTILLQKLATPERGCTAATAEGTTNTATGAARAALEQVQASLGVLRSVPAGTVYALGSYTHKLQPLVQDLIKILKTLEPHVRLVHSSALALHSYHHTAAGPAVAASMQLASAMQEAAVCIRLTLEALDRIETTRRDILGSMRLRSSSIGARYHEELQAEECKIDMAPASEAIKDTMIACDIVQRNVAALGSE
ncbi:hypothetical protein F503_03201 [Ophiostoma piceae UAMH 11346]|uniref:Uncharacterized protein n=1 Tax=Ophiostoma piceae (strain UAMH 11346) TaxID=1262450 RepID=S3BZS9_OPHP1|nr:hypothetical protein F503_03201 [Ophiostoma piceae UAMH 11346]